MPHVMDGRAVSRGLCFTHGNPTLQPSYFAMVNTASPAHASLRSSAHFTPSPPNIDRKLTHSSLLSCRRISLHGNAFSNIFASLCYHHPLRYCFDHPRAKPGKR
jgi:hypothetical protein